MSKMKSDLRVYLRIRGKNGDIHTPLVVNNDSEKFRKQSIMALNKLIKAIPKEANPDGINYHVYAVDLPHIDNDSGFDDMGDRGQKGN